jgi:hypothetical protein
MATAVMNKTDLEHGVRCVYETSAGDRTSGVCSITGDPVMIIQFSGHADSLLSLAVLCIFPATLLLRVDEIAYWQRQ